MTDGPQAALRPAAPQRWRAALVAGAERAPEPDRARALGLAAALGDGTAEQLRVSGPFAEVVAAAQGATADVPAAGLTPQDRDWVVLRRCRAGREVPCALS